MPGSTKYFTTIKKWEQSNIEHMLFVSSDDTLCSYVKRLQDIIGYIILCTDKRKSRIDFVTEKIGMICAMVTIFNDVNILNEKGAIYYFVWPHLLVEDTPVKKAKRIYDNLQRLLDSISIPTGKKALSGEEIKKVLKYLDREFHFASTILKGCKLTICPLNIKLNEMDSGIMMISQNHYIVYSTINEDPLATDVEVFVHELAHLLIQKVTGSMENIKPLKPLYRIFYKDGSSDEQLLEFIPNLICSGLLVDSVYGKHLPYNMPHEDAVYMKKVCTDAYKTM